MFASLLRQFNRVSITPAVGTLVRNVSTTQLLDFHFTQTLYGEPLKKKKRIDPAIIKAREERRRKKLAKMIRRMEKNARQLKPIEECEIPLTVLDNMDKRRRPPTKLSEQESEYRAVLLKEWSQWKHEQYKLDVQEIDRIVTAQTRALNQLSMESEDLYNAAIEPDMELVGFISKGPVATPAIPDYDSPDGEYIDISKKWDN